MQLILQKLNVTYINCLNFVPLCLRLSNDSSCSIYWYNVILDIEFDHSKQMAYTRRKQLNRVLAYICQQPDDMINKAIWVCCWYIYVYHVYDHLMEV